MTVNKTLVAGAGVAAIGVGAMAICYYYCPSQAAASWAAGDEERAGMMAEYAFSLKYYAEFFVVMILGGLVLMAAAAGSASA